jgi:hypothetical protein
LAGTSRVIHRARRHIGAIADLDRRHLGGIGADEGSFPDLGQVLAEAVVIADDGAGPDIGTCPTRASSIQAR